MADATDSAKSAVFAAAPGGDIGVLVGDPAGAAAATAAAAADKGDLGAGYDHYDEGRGPTGSVETSGHSAGLGGPMREVGIAGSGSLAPPSPSLQVPAAQEAVADIGAEGEHARRLMLASAVEGLSSVVKEFSEASRAWMKEVCEPALVAGGW